MTLEQEPLLRELLDRLAPLSPQLLWCGEPPCILQDVADGLPRGPSVEPDADPARRTDVRWDEVALGV